MPQWNWFAFSAQSVSMAMLQPAQNAVRKRDLVAWQKIYDYLSKTYLRPSVSRFYGTPVSYRPNNYTILMESGSKLSRDKVPEESGFPVRRALQIFVENISPLRMEGDLSRPSHWILSKVKWESIVSSDADREELEHFKTRIITRGEKLPDPFWCLESTEAVDSNYISPEVVAEMARIEDRVGLFRALAKRDDLGDEVRSVIREMTTASLFIQLAAAEHLAIYFREDGT